jgi:hypothetical protein
MSERAVRDVAVRETVQRVWGYGGSTAGSFLEVKGAGEWKCRVFGERFLSVRMGAMKPFSAPGRRPADRPAGPNATRARLPRPDGRPPAPGDTPQRQMKTLPPARQDRARPRAACHGQLTGCVPSCADGQGA